MLNGKIEHRNDNESTSESAKTKRGRREGDRKKNVTTICDKRPSYAMGSDFMHAAPSSLASTCGMCPSTRPGRLRGHALQFANLPRGVAVSA